MAFPARSRTPSTGCRGRCQRHSANLRRPHRRRDRCLAGPVRHAIGAAGLAADLPNARRGAVLRQVAHGGRGQHGIRPSTEASSTAERASAFERTWRGLQLSCRAGLRDSALHPSRGTAVPRLECARASHVRAGYVSARRETELSKQIYHRRRACQPARDTRSGREDREPDQRQHRRWHRGRSTRASSRCAEKHRIGILRREQHVAQLGPRRRKVIVRSRAACIPFVDHFSLPLSGHCVPR